MNILTKFDIYKVIGNGENGATILDLIVTFVGFVIFCIVYFLPIKNEHLHNFINYCVFLILLLSRVITNIYRMPLGLTIAGISLCLIGFGTAVYNYVSDKQKNKQIIKNKEK